MRKYNLDVFNSVEQFKIEQLEKACNDISKMAPVLYWQSEHYGFGKMFRKFGYYPQRFPLNICSAHGIQLVSEPRKSELENIAPFMFYFTKRLTSRFDDFGIKKCFTILSPNVFYRRKNKINKNEDAKGIIVFVGHSTSLIENISSETYYINQLQKIPKKFLPLTICLHFHDVNKGAHKEYIKAGFEVVSAGNVNHPDYIEKFYKILKNFNYATSNMIGSYTFYAVEMGIPFFLFGDEPVLFNKGNRNMELGVYNAFKKEKEYSKAVHLFGDITTDINEEQRKFIEVELGINDSISRIKMSSILYYSLFLYLQNRFFQKLKMLLRKVILIVGLGSFFRIKNPKKKKVEE